MKLLPICFCVQKVLHSSYLKPYGDLEATVYLSWKGNFAGFEGVQLRGRSLLHGSSLLLRHAVPYQ